MDANVGFGDGASCTQPREEQSGFIESTYACCTGAFKRGAL